MEMDIYSLESDMLSLSNLAAIKAFYDAGIDLNRLNNIGYLEDIQYSAGTGYNILLEGCQGLFDEVSFLNYEELEGYEEHFKDEKPEYALIIKDERLSKIIQSKYQHELIEIIPSHLDEFDYSDVVFNIHSSRLFVEIHFGHFAHELALKLCEIDKKLNEIITRLKEEHKIEVSDNVNR